MSTQINLTWNQVFVQIERVSAFSLHLHKWRFKIAVDSNHVGPNSKPTQSI